MKKSALALAALMVAGEAQALIDASVFGGYTTVNMGSVNKKFDDDEKSDKAAGDTVTMTKFSGGFIVGAEAGVSVFPFLHLGPRLEYIGVSPASYKSTGSGGTSESTAEGSLTNLLASLHTSISLPLTGLSVKGAAYAGHGMGVIKSTVKNAAGTFTVTNSGAGFVSGLEAGLGYEIIPTVNLDLNVGYRLADLRAMHITDSNTSFVTKNTPSKYTDSSGKVQDVEFDFGGISATFGVRFDF